MVAKSKYSGWTVSIGEDVYRGMRCELYVPFNLDVFNVDKYLINHVNGVPLSIQFYPAIRDFSLMSETVAKEYKVMIDQAILQVNFMDMITATVLACPDALERLTYYTITLRVRSLPYC